VALKVIHLLTRLEKIERDLSEIANLQNSLQENRDYAQRLQESLQEEQLRLRELQNRIHSQVVKNPPAELAAALIGAPAESAAAPRVVAPGRPAAFLEPEVILPTERPEPPARKPAPATTAAPADRTPPPAAASGPDAGQTGASDEDFSFRFIQK
jgi:hypothetical protein